MGEEAADTSKRRTWLKIGSLAFFAMVVILVIAGWKTDQSALAQQSSRSAPMTRAPLRVALPTTEQINEIRAIMRDCHDPWEKVGDIPGSALGRVAARNIVTHASEACGDSGMKLRELRKGHESEPLGDIIQFCQAATEERQVAAESITALFDSGPRQSAVEKSRVALVNAARAGMACDGALG